MNLALFNDYLRKAIRKPYTPEEFKAWLKTTKKIDPGKLGLEG